MYVGSGIKGVVSENEGAREIWHHGLGSGITSHDQGQSDRRPCMCATRKKAGWIETDTIEGPGSRPSSRL